MRPTTLGRARLRKRWVLRRGAWLLVSQMGDVTSDALSVGAALDRFRRRPKWARRNAAGYVHDAIGELLGEEPSPFIFLGPQDAPIPEFIREWWRALATRKSSPPTWLPIEPAELEARIRADAKLYYAILNHTMDAETAEREMRLTMVEDAAGRVPDNIRNVPGYRVDVPRIIHPWEVP